MASFEALERTLTRLQRQDLTVLEDEPAKALVAAEDVLHTDEFGREMVVVPAGCEPASWVELTAAEKPALVHPDDAPKSKVDTGPFGFNPEDAKAGRIRVKVIDNLGPRP
jgi:hypothetical protein